MFSNKLGLNLGSGPLPLGDVDDIHFINLDFDSQYAKPGYDFVQHNLHDLPMPFPDNHFDFINMSQVFEHFHIQDGINILVDCYRILKSSGWIRISVPDAALLVRMYLAGRMDEFASVQPPIYSKMQSQMLKFGMILFGALYSHGELGHKQAYDGAGLIEVVSKTGFMYANIVGFDARFDAKVAENHQVAVLAGKPE